MPVVPGERQRVFDVLRAEQHLEKSLETDTEPGGHRLSSTTNFKVPKNWSSIF